MSKEIFVISVSISISKIGELVVEATATDEESKSWAETDFALKVGSWAARWKGQTCKLIDDRIDRHDEIMDDLRAWLSDTYPGKNIYVTDGAAQKS